MVEMSSREEALEWAAKIAVVCPCAQEARQIMPDPDVCSAHHPVDVFDE